MVKFSIYLNRRVFVMFINDIGDEMCVTGVPILHDTRISHLLYADDLVLLSTSETGLQRNIDKVYDFRKKWGLAVNIEKKKKKH